MVLKELNEKFNEKTNKMTTMQKVSLVCCCLAIFGGLFLLAYDVTFQTIEYKNRYTDEVYCVKHYVLGNLVNSTCNESKEGRKNWKEEFFVNLSNLE